MYAGGTNMLIVDDEPGYRLREPLCDKVQPIALIPAQVLGVSARTGL